MNIIAWNRRDALKPSFQNQVRELVNNHNPAVLIIMETRISGDRACEITDKLPFDGVIHTDTIGYVGGLWMLWNLNKVEVSPFTNTKQEIHVTIKVWSSNSSWVLSTIYASLRSAERKVLWNKLSKGAELHNMP